MSSSHPIRQALQNLTNEFIVLNTDCLHFTVELNALITERTNIENKKLKRRLCHCLGLWDKLEPQLAKEYKDKTPETLRALRNVGCHYDDLKRRYLWALQKIADLNTELDYYREKEGKREALAVDLGDDWDEFYRNYDRGADGSGSTRTSNQIRDIDEILGMRFLPTFEDYLPLMQKRRRGSSIFRTAQNQNAVNDQKTTNAETGDIIGKFHNKFRVEKVQHTPNKAKRTTQDVMDVFREGVESTLKVIASLRNEIEDRDNRLSDMATRMKIKDARISLLEAIQCGKNSTHELQNS